MKWNLNATTGRSKLPRKILHGFFLKTFQASFFFINNDKNSSLPKSDLMGDEWLYKTLTCNL